jgi:hypothetical protein
MRMENDNLHRVDVSITDTNEPQGNDATDAASSSPTREKKVGVIPKSKLPYVPLRPAKPISGFSLFFSAAWAMVRGWFKRKT